MVKKLNPSRHISRNLEPFPPIRGGRRREGSLLGEMRERARCDGEGGAGGEIGSVDDAEPAVAELSRLRERDLRELFGSGRRGLLG